MSGMRWFAVALVCALLSVVSGCGRSGVPASFVLQALPAAVVIADGGAAQTLTVEASTVNGFVSPVTVTVTGLPAGVTASPATLTLMPGTLQQISLSAVGAAVTTTATAALVGTGNGVTSTLPLTVEVTPSVTTAALSATRFHFGDDLVGNTLTRSVATVSNTGSAALTLAPTVTGSAGFAVVTTPFAKQCGATLAAGDSCVLRVSFTPPAVSAVPLAGRLELGFGNVAQGTPGTVELSGTSAALAPGVVTATANPQVAEYTMNLPYPGAVKVNFGTDTTYGRSTWSQSTATAGPVSILVAGMLPMTTYHMQATVTFADGVTAKDVDQTFTTQDSLLHAQISTSVAPGATPQAGVEQLTFLMGSPIGLMVTDLSGRVLWSYAVANVAAGNLVQGATLMPNGHYLVTIAPGSPTPLTTPQLPDGGIDSVREIDLAGNIIKQITATDLNAELAHAGYDLSLQLFHHDVLVMPNGHWLVLANTLKTFQDLDGLPGATTVLGDVVIDLDTNLQPTWVWNTFDHLDVNRHPYLFPDWTHSNALVYSATDGNLLLSIRHQNWVLKIDYQNGAGSGAVLWRLGEGGDFTLQGGVDPTDWFYAQHAPSFFSQTTAGVFSLGVFDDGDDRIFPAGVMCGTAGAPACQYSSVPVMQVDETARTATLTSHEILPANLYSYFGGNVELLANGDIEFDVAGSANLTSSVIEQTYGAGSTTGGQPVWEMDIAGGQAYRGRRLPSLYPGVQW